MRRAIESKNLASDMKKVTKKSTKEVPQYDNVRAALKACGGRVFQIEFIKRTTGELRKMNARLGVSKNVTGKGLAFNPKSNNLIVCWDMQKGAHRMISVENIKKIKLNGIEYNF